MCMDVAAIASVAMNATGVRFRVRNTELLSGPYSPISPFTAPVMAPPANIVGREEGNLNLPMNVVRANITRQTHTMRVMRTFGAMAKPKAPSAVKGMANKRNCRTFFQQIFLKPSVIFAALLMSCATAATGTATCTPDTLAMAGMMTSPPLQPTAPDKNPAAKPTRAKNSSSDIRLDF